MSELVSDYFKEWLELVNYGNQEVKKINKITQKELDKLKSLGTDREEYMSYLSELVSEDKIRLIDIGNPDFTEQTTDVTFTLRYSLLEKDNRITKEKER